MTKQLRTACPLDCPDLCSIDVRIADDRVAEISGAAEHPITNGFICRKVRHYAEHVYGDARLTTPLRRTGPKGTGTFESISWDEALDEVVHRVREAIDRHGGEAILPYCYGGSNGKLTQDAVDARFFRRLGASRLARTVCAAPTGSAFTGLYGKMPGVAFPDYVHARLIVVWGANPNASGIHLVPFIRAAQKAGSKLVVVDPRNTALAKQADLHLPIRPGTDVAVALSVMRWLFEAGAADEEFLARHATGVAELRERASHWSFDRAADVAQIPASSLAEFAQLYAQASPAVIRCGWGLERNRNGGSAAAAVMALPAVAGKFGVRGGGFTMSSSAAWQFDAEAAVNEPAAATRIVNMNRLGRTLLEENEPPVQVLFVYNANPLATVPDQRRIRQGLLRPDLFTTVFDQVMTDTAKFADLVLPATTFLEHEDYRVGYGTGYLAKVNPVIAPVGQARSNYDVFADLCARMDLQREDDPVEPEAIFQRLVQLDGESREAFDRSGWLPPPPGPGPIQFEDVFPNTADGKIQLVPAELDREAPGGLYHYQSEPAQPPGSLVLISPATAATVSSTLGQLGPGQVAIELHPQDADQRGIAAGDAVRVFNRWGEVHCGATVNPDLKPGVAVLPKGLWQHQTLNGNTANALASDELSDLGGGACFNDARVQVTALIGE